MTTRIELDGNRYLFVGRFKGDTAHDLMNRLDKLGAEDAWSMSYADYVISSGKQVGNKESKARARGLPVLTYEQALLLADQGYIDLEESPIAEDMDLDEVIAELRGIFGEAPSSPSWTRCLELVERCHDEQLDPVLHYIDSQLDAWASQAKVAWRPPHDHPLLKGVPKHWPLATFDDALCVAPPSWIQEMTQKIYHPKHRLVRALHLDDLSLNTLLLGRILKNPYLTHLTHTNMGAGNYPTEHFYRTFTTLTSMQKVTTLWLHYVHGEFYRALCDNPTPLDKLETLRLRSSFSTPEQIARIDCLARATEVSIEPPM